MFLNRQVARLLIITAVISTACGRNPGARPASPLKPPTAEKTTSVDKTAPSPTPLEATRNDGKSTPGESYREKLNAAKLHWNFDEVPKSTWSDDQLKKIEKADAAQARQLVKCKDRGSCPEGLAAVTAFSVDNQGGWSSKNSFSCTGALVASDILMVPRSCVDQIAQHQFGATGLQCSDVLRVFFPETKHRPAEAVRCGRVIGTSPDLGAQGQAPDFAFIRLRRKVDRTPLEINRAGLPADGNVSVFHHESGKSEAQWVFKSLTCKADYNSLLEPRFIHQLDAVIQLADCAIGPDDAGALVLDGSGKLIAQVDGQTNPNQLMKLSATLRQAGLLDYQASWRGWATNMACVPAPAADATDLPQVCDSLFQSSKTDLEVDENMMKAVNKELVRWTQTVPEVVQWKADRQKLSEIPAITFAPVPECVNAKALNASSYRKSFGMPVITLKYNSFLQPTADVTIFGPPVPAQLDLTALDSSKYHVTFSKTADDHPTVPHAHVFFDGTLPACP